MLVIDFYTLKTVNTLNLIGEVLLKSLRATCLQQVVWRYWTFGNLITTVKEVAFTHNDVFTHRDQVICMLASVHISHDDLLLTAHIRAVGNFTVDLSDGAGLLRTTCFEELGDTWQTTSNITSLGNLTRCSSKLSTTLNASALFHRKVGTHRDGTAVNDFRSLLINDDNLRVEVFLMLGDHHSLLACFLVSLRLDSNALDHVTELNFTSFLSENWHVVRIPGYKDFAFFDLFTIRN